MDALEQFVYFDEDSYRREVGRLNETQLRDLQATVKRKKIGANIGVRAGFQGAVQSYGLSLFGSAVSVRRLSVNEQRLAIIDARMKAKGWADYNARKRDYVAPIAAAAVVAAIMPGADTLVGHMAHNAAAHVATTAHVATAGGAHHAAGIANAVAAHPGVATKAIEHGAEAQINELTRGAVGHAAINAAPVTDLATQNAATVGYAAGEALARAGEQKALSSAIAKATDVGVRKTAAGMKGSDKTSKRTQVTVERVAVTPPDDGITFEFVDEPWNPSGATSTTRRISFERADPACAPEPVLVSLLDECTSLEMLERAYAPIPIPTPPAHTARPRKRGKDKSKKPTPQQQLEPSIELAIENNNAKLIARLVKRDAGKADRKLNAQGEPPIVLAARCGKLNAAKALLEAGASINRTDKRGYTALMVACEKGDHVMANLFVSSGADLDVKAGGKRARDIAKARKDDFIYGMLRNAGA